VDDRGVATAMVAGFLVIGTEVGVQRVIDTHANAGRSLADSQAAQAIADSLPDDSLVQAYLSEDGAQRLLAGNPGPLSSFDTFVNFDSTVGAGAALVAADDGLELDVRSELDPASLKTNPGFFDAFSQFEPRITDELPPRSLAYLGLGDPQASIQKLLAQAQSQAPGLVVGFEDFAKRLKKAGNVSVESDLLPVLGGEAAFSIQPPAPAPSEGGGARSKNGEGEAGAGQSAAAGGSTTTPQIPESVQQQLGAPPPEAVAPPSGTSVQPGTVQGTGAPYLTFIGTNVDPTVANEALAKLQAPLAKALVPQAGQAPTFDESTVDGVTVHSVRISPAVDLTYAIFDGKLVVSTQPDGVARVASGPGGLSDSALYQRATDGFPDRPALLLYLNLHELLDLAEQAGLADVSAYLPFAGEATRLAAGALVVERGDTTLDTQIRLVLAQPSD
jgi:hypothetical protein